MNRKGISTERAAMGLALLFFDHLKRGKERRARDE